MDLNSKLKVVLLKLFAFDMLERAHVLFMFSTFVIRIAASSK